MTWLLKHNHIRLSRQPRIQELIGSQTKCSASTSFRHFDFSGFDFRILVLTFIWQEKASLLNIFWSTGYASQMRGPARRCVMFVRWVGIHVCPSRLCFSNEQCGCGAANAFESLLCKNKINFFSFQTTEPVHLHLEYSFI